MRIKKKNRNQTTEEEEEKGGGSACFGTKGKMEAAIIKKLNCMRPQKGQQFQLDAPLFLYRGRSIRK
jgi:hypothetical protein